jgi:hypothetical protein
MDHQLQKLFDLGLKAVLLFLYCFSHIQLLIFRGMTLK